MLSVPINNTRSRSQGTWGFGLIDEHQSSNPFHCSESDGWYPGFMASSSSRARRSLVRMTSALLVHTKGLGLALWHSR